MDGLERTALLAPEQDLAYEPGLRAVRKQKEDRDEQPVVVLKAWLTQANWQIDGFNDCCAFKDRDECHDGGEPAGRPLFDREGASAPRGEPQENAKGDRAQCHSEKRLAEHHCQRGAAGGGKQGGPFERHTGGGPKVRLETVEHFDGQVSRRDAPTARI